ncbi:MAG: HepT-like ribonuclease domain-containing protein [Flavobacteriaceae bacterium]
MEIKIKKLLFDILTSIENIETYIGEEKKFENYDSNPMLQDAVERNIEIIGEAINKILSLQPDIPITNSRRIVDAQNKIIHGYDSIENTQIWGIVILHLPVLKNEVSNLLK